MFHLNSTKSVQLGCRDWWISIHYYNGGEGRRISHVKTETRWFPRSRSNWCAASLVLRWCALLFWSMIFLFLFSTPRRQSDKRQQIDTLARAGAKAETEVTSETDAQREDQMSAVLPRVPPPSPLVPSVRCLEISPPLKLGNADGSHQCADVSTFSRFHQLGQQKIGPDRAFWVRN